MGVLHYKIDLAFEDGSVSSNKPPITDVYIWRDEAKEHDDDWLTYKASRTPPDLITYTIVEDITLSGVNAYSITYTNQPIVEFRHKYSDGAELCVARAIMALQEAGLNV